jgi:hypothetical protein
MSDYITRKEMESYVQDQLQEHLDLDHRGTVPSCKHRMTGFPKDQCDKGGVCSLTRCAAATRRQEEGAFCGSLLLEQLHHAYAQTDGSYKFPNSREGDMLKQAKKEIEQSPTPTRSDVAREVLNRVANIRPIDADLFKMTELLVWLNEQVEGE